MGVVNFDSIRIHRIFTMGRHDSRRNLRQARKAISGLSPSPPAFVRRSGVSSDVYKIIAGDWGDHLSKTDVN